MQTCTHVFKNGSKKGTACGRPLRNNRNDGLCWTHKKKVKPLLITQAVEGVKAVVKNDFIQLTNSKSRKRRH